jgi:hypothetical protein
MYYLCAVARNYADYLFNTMYHVGVFRSLRKIATITEVAIIKEGKSLHLSGDLLRIH